MKNCIYCNSEMDDNFKFCPFCGKNQIKKPRSGKKRGNGQGTIFRKNGNWAVEITLGYYIENGKKKRRARRKQGFKTKKDAILYLEQLYKNDNKNGVPTFSELWENIKPDIETLSKSKQSAYKIAWNRIEKALAHRQIDDIKTPELQKIAAVADTYYTRRDVKSLLSKLYKAAIRDEYITINRAEFIALPEKEETERETFSDNEIAAVWSDYRLSPSPITAAVLIMLYTGMRPGEIKKLDFDKIHLNEHYLTGGIKTKKSKNRKIIIPDKIIPIFQYLISENIIYSEFGRNYLAEQWEKKAPTLGIRSEIVLYCCRHTYLTRLTALGVSPAMLQELAGHEDYDTTLNYTHLSIAERLEEVNRL